MIENIPSFPDVTKEEWVAQLTKELKGQPLSLLYVIDPVEEIELSAYQHRSDDKHVLLNPGQFPFERGFDRDSNTWNNGLEIYIEKEEAANAMALKWLMAGVNHLVFKPLKASINWETVLKEIQLEYITVHFETNRISDLAAVHKIAGDLLYNNTISFAFDIDQIPDLLSYLQVRQFKAIQVDSYVLQQCGSASFQEIGYLLNQGHEVILKLMNAGLSIDESTACLHFRSGVGSNYLLESVKFNVLRSLWSSIVSAYEPTHQCSHNISITAVIGHMNKSLKDPYTNILRQTTEALSAINGGANNLIIKPYDQYSNRPSELATRMAVNISLILGEEAHLDKVIDPLGGSYVIDALFEQLKDKSWHFFLHLEKASRSNEDIVLVIEKLVKPKRELRIDNLKTGSKVLIGVNKFPNTEQSGLNWELSDEVRFGTMSQLILEKEVNP